jgi:CDP-glycerol glycerophosphotransferase
MMKKKYIKKIIADLFILPLWYVFDCFTKKQNSFWGFIVHPIDIDHFSESPRAVFEHIKRDNSIKKIVFIRNENSDLLITESVNTEIVLIDSVQGMWLLAKCKVLIVSNSVSYDYTLRFGTKWFSINTMNMTRRIVVNVWHGIPIKKVFSMWNPELKKRYDRVSYRKYERENYSGLVVSSKMDSYAMAAIFHPIEYSKLWITGLAKNDFLLNKIEELPSYLIDQVKKIQEIKSNKILIIYTPTFRQTVAIKESFYYKFKQNDLKKMKCFLQDHNAILGIRMHYIKRNDNVAMIEALVDNEFIFDFGNIPFPEIGAVIRESDLVISDYSSVFLDALYVNKPLVCFAYDLESYSKNQDGLLYDLDLIFPGLIVQSFDVLLSEMDAELSNPHQVKSEKYQFVRRLFFEYTDNKNSERIVSKIKSLL